MVKKRDVLSNELSDDNITIDKLISMLMDISGDASKIEFDDNVTAMLRVTSRLARIEKEMKTLRWFVRDARREVQLKRSRDNSRVNN